MCLRRVASAFSDFSVSVGACFPAWGLRRSRVSPPVWSRRENSRLFVQKWMPCSAYDVYRKKQKKPKKNRGGPVKRGLCYISESSSRMRLKEHYVVSGREREIKQNKWTNMFLLTLKNNTASYCFALFTCGGPCHLSSFPQCSGDLIFLWEQLVYSGTDKINVISLYYYLINTVNIRILSSSPFNQNISDLI